MEPSDRLDLLLALYVVLSMLVLANWLWGYLAFIRGPYRHLAGLVAIGLMWGPEMSFHAAMVWALAVALCKLATFLVKRPLVVVAFLLSVLLQHAIALAVRQFDGRMRFLINYLITSVLVKLVSGIASPLPHVSPAPASASPLPLPRPPTSLQPQPTPGLLQARFPQDLLASEVLPYLTPYEVTRLLPTCQLFNQAGEQPVYWKLAAQRGRLALLVKFDQKELVDEEQ